MMDWLSVDQEVEPVANYCLRPSLCRMPRQLSKGEYVQGAQTCGRHDRVSVTIPKLTVIYAALLAAFGFFIGVWAWAAPDSFLDAGGLTLSGDAKDVVLLLFAARNLAFGVLFALAVAFARSRDVFLVVFGARFSVDLFDTVALMTADNYDAGAFNLASQFIFFLIPTAFVLVDLVRRRPESRGVRAA